MVFVSPVLRPLLEEELDAERIPAIQAVASRNLYEEWWQEPSERGEARSLEILRLALAGSELEIAVRVGSAWAHVLFGQSRFREATVLCKTVSAKLEDYRVLASMGSLRAGSRQHGSLHSAFRDNTTHRSS